MQAARRGGIARLRRRAGLVGSLVLAIAAAPACARDAAAETKEEIPAETEAERLPELVVEAPRPTTAASSEEVRRRDLEERPRLRPADILEVTPGLIVVQHAGGGKANQYFLRGFDADHGTDLALFVDGVPVNMLSHGHGQGYADLHFLIPELVETEQVNKGPYVLEYGDLATAGAVNLVLRRHLGERSVTVQGGEFGVRRGLAMADLPTPGLDSWIAGEAYTQDGPFEHPEDLVRYNLVARTARSLATGSVSLTATSYAADWDASGQIPLRAVRAGRLDRFGAIDPSEGGHSGRHQLYAEGDLEPSAAWDVHALGYAVLYDLSLFSNFTFFRDDPVNGDQINQRDDRFVGGVAVDATHHAAAGSIALDTRVGTQLRTDRIDNALDHTRRRALVERITRNAITQLEAGWYAGEDIAWTEWLRTIVGVRLDHLAFDVRDRLRHPPRSPRRSAGRASETVASPKATAVLTPRPGWDVFLNFGRGFHSNDARGITRRAAPADPSAAATGAEVGTRARLLDRLDVAAAYFLLDLESELVFVGDAGTTEPSGRTRRHGLELEARWRITEWLSADVDFTRSVARFRDAPAGADEVPLAPRYTVSGGLSARHPRGLFAIVRSRTVSDRPANEADTLTAKGYSVVDLEAGWTFRAPRLLGPEPPLMTITVDVLNLLDADYREAQFDTASCLRGELGREPRCSGPAPSGISDIHFTPGWPRTILAALKVAF